MHDEARKMLLGEAVKPVSKEAAIVVTAREYADLQQSIRRMHQEQLRLTQGIAQAEVRMDELRKRMHALVEPAERQAS